MNDEIAGMRCGHCSAQLTVKSRFCGACGSEVSPLGRDDVHTDVFKTLSPSLSYYFITLILLAVYKFSTLFPDGFEGFLVVCAIETILVTAFFLTSRDGSGGIYHPGKLRISVAAVTILGALALSALVTIMANTIQITIEDDVFYNMYLFEDTAYPTVFSVIFICLQPALFEEVAFRGFLFSNVQKLTTPNGAMYVTGFLFGIIHLAFISMLWLVPLGLLFAFMRIRYNTIWYGIIGHFFYNLGVIVLEYTHYLDWR